MKGNLNEMASKAFGHLKVWEKVDGYKTMIGISLMTLGYFLQECYEIWQLELPTPVKVFKVLINSGALLAGVGGIHKMVKK